MGTQFLKQATVQFQHKKEQKKEQMQQSSIGFDALSGPSIQSSVVGSSSLVKSVSSSESPGLGPTRTSDGSGPGSFVGDERERD